MPEHETTHGDILRAIGSLEGKLDGIISNMANNRSDILTLFERLNRAEQRIAQGVILAIVVSFVMPIAVAMIAPRIEFGPLRTQLDRPR